MTALIEAKSQKNVKKLSSRRQLAAKKYFAFGNKLPLYYPTRLSSIWLILPIKRN